MALTYRSGKGSALTHDELDNNFRHFTGSHDITGSVTISGSADGTHRLTVLGSLNTNSFISASSYISASNFSGDLTGSVLGTASTASYVAVGAIDQPFTNITASGNISASGDIFGDEINSSGVDANSGFTLLSLNTKPVLYTDGTTLKFGANLTSDPLHIYSTAITASGHISASGYISGDGNSVLSGLPTSEPTIVGGLWVSGSSIQDPDSGYLMVFKG